MQRQAKENFGSEVIEKIVRPEKYAMKMQWTVENGES